MRYFLATFHQSHHSSAQRRGYIISQLHFSIRRIRAAQPTVTRAIYSRLLAISLIYDDAFTPYHIYFMSSFVFKKMLLACHVGAASAEAMMIFDVISFSQRFITRSSRVSPITGNKVMVRPRRRDEFRPFRWPLEPTTAAFSIAHSFLYAQFILGKVSATSRRKVFAPHLLFLTCSLPRPRRLIFRVSDFYGLHFPCVRRFNAPVSLGYARGHGLEADVMRDTGSLTSFARFTPD